MSRVLVVAAHPDDEILGVGATIARHVEQGDTARCLILGEGQTSRFETREEADMELVKELHEDTEKAAKVIGYEKVYFADFPDNRFDHVDLLDIVKSIESVISEYKPDIVYTHHGGDLNVDHQYTFRGVLTATRPVGDYSVKEVYTFETLSSTEWNFQKESVFFPNVFVDVEAQIQKKLEAMKCYQSELCQFPHPRSIQMLLTEAQRWGSIVGKQYAEAFSCVRMIK